MNAAVTLLLSIALMGVIFFMVVYGGVFLVTQFRDSRRNRAEIAFRKMEEDYARRKLVVDSIISKAMGQMTEAAWTRSDRPDDFGMKSGW